MIFWHSSAILPMLVDEPATQTVRDIVSDDPVIVVWWATRVECSSALSRLRREDRLPTTEVDAAKRRHPRVREVREFGVGQSIQQSLMAAHMGSVYRL